MEKQKSVVEFLKEKLEEGHLDISSRYWNELLTEAKAMEDGQKIQFATEYALHIIKGGFLTPTEFYNEKFKSE